MVNKMQDFVCLTIDRQDIEEALGLPEMSAEVLTDDQMKSIARAVCAEACAGDYYGLIAGCIPKEIKAKLEVTKS